jgi:potassium channel LctB
MGYLKVRHYHGGIEDWTQSGSPFQTGSMPLPIAAPIVPKSAAAPAPTEVVHAPALSRLTEIVHQWQWGSRLVELIDRQSTSRLFMVWIALTIFFGMGYWAAGLVHHSGLYEEGRRLDGSLHGLISALYFSFVTVTSVGYGDILPRGIARVMAVAEAITGLLIFGAVISKFVSRRQDQAVAEIHRITFEERLDRIQTNLLMVLSELQWVSMMFADKKTPVERVSARLESTALVFAGELRTVHYLLYRPQQAPEEPVLAGILAGLASALNTLEDCLRAVPDGYARSPVLAHAVKTLSHLAGDICATCVPTVYAPTLTVWMDEIHDIAGRIA